MVQFKVSHSMVPLVYGDSESENSGTKNDTGKTHSSGSSSTSVSSPDTASVVSSGTPKKEPVMSSDAKKRLEQQRTELYAEMEEYKAKLALTGVTVKEFGPAVMRLLGFLLNRKDRNKTQQKDKSESSTASSASESSASEGGGSSASSAFSSKSEAEQKKVRKKNLTTRRFERLFGEKKLTNQSNQKQQRDALVLYSLFKKLNISQNCIDGSKLKADIQQKVNKPNRYIFLFFKTIKGKQYVVGFVSGTKTGEDNTAVIDYVCPRLDQPPDDTTKWRNAEELGNLVAYGILKMMWLNNDKGEKKYASVSYKNHPFTTSKDVFARLDRLKIDPYAQQTMGFKRSSEAASASEE